MTPNRILARLDAQSRRHDLLVRGVKVCWREWGSGPAMVLLHGGTGSWTHWVRSVPYLAQRFRVLVPDLPGMGDSGDIDQREPPEALVSEIADLLRHSLGGLAPAPTPLHLAGFSYGAMVGACLAADLASGATDRAADGLVKSPQDPVRSYTMLGGSGLGLSFPGPGRLAKPAPRAGPAELREMHRHNMAAIMFADPARVDPLALAVQLHNAARVRVQTHRAAQTTVMLEPLARITAPKHALWGTMDPFLPQDEAALDARLARLGIEKHLIPGAGHWAAYEAATEVNRRLLGIAGDG